MATKKYIALLMMSWVSCICYGSAPLDIGDVLLEPFTCLAGRTEGTITVTPRGGVAPFFFDFNGERQESGTLTGITTENDITILVTDSLREQVEATVNAGPSGIDTINFQVQQLPLDGQNDGVFRLEGVLEEGAGDEATIDLIRVSDGVRIEPTDSNNGPEFFSEYDGLAPVGYELTVSAQSGENCIGIVYRFSLDSQPVNEIAKFLFEKHCNV